MENDSLTAELNAWSLVSILALFFYQNFIPIISILR